MQIWPARTARNFGPNRRMQFPNTILSLKYSGAGRAAPENSSARAGAFRGPRLHAEAGYPRGDPLPHGESARSLQRVQVPIGQAPEPAQQPCLDEDIADRTFARQANETSATRLLLLNLQAPRRLALVAGAVGLLLVPALGVLGYQWLSKLNSAGSAPVPVMNTVVEKTLSAGEVLSGEKRLDRSANTSPIDQPKKVRIVTFRRHGGAVSTPASGFTLGERSNLDAFAVGPINLSPVDAADGEAAGIPTSPHLEQSKSISSAASSAVQTIDNQDVSRAAAMPAPDSVRNRKIPCQSAAGRGGHWAWRIIDSRKCWYEGKAGMSKNNLRWGP